MKTDAKTMAEIYRHMADNLDAGIDQVEGIGYLQLKSQKWVKKETIIFDFEHTQYCILPKTITVNGVEIPKPLDVSELNLSEGEVYSPSAHFRLFHNEDAEIAYRNFSLNDIYYLTMQEAIEASKKLFGIE